MVARSQYEAVAVRLLLILALLATAAPVAAQERQPAHGWGAVESMEVPLPVPTPSKRTVRNLGFLAGFAFGAWLTYNEQRDDQNYGRVFLVGAGFGFGTALIIEFLYLQ